MAQGLRRALLAPRVRLVPTIQAARAVAAVAPAPQLARQETAQARVEATVESLAAAAALAARAMRAHRAGRVYRAPVAMVPGLRL